jgi:surface polysaccharide O-acyltransferase-like enzyme
MERAAIATRHDTVKVSEGFPWVSMIWPAAWWVVYYAFGLLIGRYIYRDATEREWVFMGIRPVWWALLALFDPAFGLLVYWALHYSKLAQSYHEATARPSAPMPDA